MLASNGVLEADANTSVLTCGLKARAAECARRRPRGQKHTQSIRNTSHSIPCARSFLLRPVGSQDLFYKLENFGWSVSRPTVTRVTFDLPECTEP